MTNYSVIQSYMNRCIKSPAQALPHHLQSKSPLISIIVPVYNQWHLTRACLNSIIFASSPELPCEIILADDCSSDETLNAAEQFSGLNIKRTNKNLGFLRNCNYAASLAKGQYFMLLNNDTIVLPGWLSNAYQCMQSSSQIALVGSKILYPSGKIQEAGCQLFNDASDSHLGRNHKRSEPDFNQTNEVDCVSGCSMLIRRSFWERVRGFDERYVEAYFEDYDLAMAARHVGMKVMYEPTSELIHFEHQTYSAIQNTKHETLSNFNKTLFVEKWRAQLMHSHPNPIPKKRSGLIDRISLLVSRWRETNKTTSQTSHDLLTGSSDSAPLLDPANKSRGVDDAER